MYKTSLEKQHRPTDYIEKYFAIIITCDQQGYCEFGFTISFKAPVEISTKLSTGFQMPGKVIKENGKSQKWKRKSIKVWEVEKNPVIGQATEYKKWIKMLVKTIICSVLQSCQMTKDYVKNFNLS